MSLEFMDLLSQIPDPRQAQGKKWQLGPVLLATILAILSGATSYRKVHRFIETHRERLNLAFDFGWNSAPAYSAVRFILQGLDGADVERAFRAHAAMLNSGEANTDTEAMPVVAIDGKTLRHSFDAFNDRKAAHVLSAFAVDDVLILGHLVVDGKSNEIPAAQAMIKALKLEERLFTLDAMHCQKTFQAALDAKCHLLVQVKENQPGLRRKIDEGTGSAAPFTRYETLDRKKRMRHETRITEVFDAGPVLAQTPWSGLIASIIRVERSTLMRCAKDGMWRPRAELSFYVCSTPLTAKSAAEAIRGHWGIENRNHYVRDVSMLEDASRIRANPGIFARARSFALNILRANAETNIADALWRNAIDFNRLLKYRYE